MILKAAEYKVWQCQERLWRWGSGTLRSYSEKLKLPVVQEC